MEKELDFSFLTDITSLDDICMSKKDKEDLEWSIQMNAHQYIHGKAGIGKTLTVTTLAKKVNRELIHINASDSTTVESLREQISDSYHGVGIDGRECIIFFDECESLKQSNPAHTKKITEYLKMLSKEATVAIVFCANEDDQVPDSIKRFCSFHMHLKPPTKSMIVKWVNSMVQKHCLDISVERFNDTYGKKVRELAERCNGDLRYFTKSLVEGEYEHIQVDRRVKIQDLVRWVYSARDRMKLRDVLIETLSKHKNDRIVNPINLLHWLEENFYRCNKNSPDFIDNLEILQDASLFYGDIIKFCSILSSLIPWRTIRTLKFPQFYDVLKDRKKREAEARKRKEDVKVKRKRVSLINYIKNKDVKTKPVKVIENDGGLARWFK